MDENVSNTDKTKCMTFHTRQKNIDPLTFSMNGKQLENVKFFKFLQMMNIQHGKLTLP